jgi:DNA-binding transcriptional LysR family regulator
VSYAITTLESQLGTRLFDRSGQRTRVAPEGVALLAEMAAIVARTDALRQQARAMSEGREPLVQIVADALFDITAIGATLQEFARTFEATRIAIEVETMQRVLDRVTAGDAHMGLLASLSTVPAHLRSMSLPPLRLIPVAHANHPIAQERHFTEDAQHAHIQIVLGERGESPSPGSYFVFASRTWRVTELSAKHALLLAGVGWGYMPEHWVHADLAAGTLVHLRLPGIPAEDSQPVFVVWHARQAPGPCAQWLIDRTGHQPG